MTCDWTPLRQLSLSIVTVCPKTCDFKDESHISGSSTRRLPGSSLFRQDQNHESPAVQPAAQVHKYCPVLGGSVQIGPGLDEAAAMRTSWKSPTTFARWYGGAPGKAQPEPDVWLSTQPIM